MSPLSPLSPLSPFGPCDPVAPVAPFRLVNAKSNTFAVFEPDAVTVTEGTPTVLDTVAVGVPKPAAAPAGPCEPVSPLGPVAP